MAKHGYKIAALVLLVAAGVLSAQELNPPSVKGGVSIQLPKGWLENPPGPGGRTLLVGAAPQKDKDQTGEYPASLSISVAPGAKIDVAAEQKQLTALPGYKADGQPVAITVNGLQGVMLGGSLTNGAVVLQSQQYIFVQNNQKYVITFTSLKSRFPAYRATVEASIGTFRVAK